MMNGDNFATAFIAHEPKGSIQVLESVELVKYLSSLHLSYRVVDVSQPGIGITTTKLALLSGVTTLPQLFVGNHFVGTWSTICSMKESDLIDTLLSAGYVDPYRGIKTPTHSNPSSIGEPPNMFDVVPASYPYSEMVEYNGINTPTHSTPPGSTRARDQEIASLRRSDVSSRSLYALPLWQATQNPVSLNKQPQQPNIQQYESIKKSAIPSTNPNITSIQETYLLTEGKTPIKSNDALFTTHTRPLRTQTYPEATQYLTVADNFRTGLHGALYDLAGDIDEMDMDDTSSKLDDKDGIWPYAELDKARTEFIERITQRLGQLEALVEMERKSAALRLDMKAAQRATMREKQREHTDIMPPNPMDLENVVLREEQWEEEEKQAMIRDIENEAQEEAERVRRVQEEFLMQQQMLKEFDRQWIKNFNRRRKGVPTVDFVRGLAARQLELMCEQLLSAYLESKQSEEAAHQALRVAVAQRLNAEYDLQMLSKRTQPLDPPRPEHHSPGWSLRVLQSDPVKPEPDMMERVRKGGDLESKMAYLLLNSTAYNGVVKLQACARGVSLRRRLFLGQVPGITVELLEATRRKVIALKNALRGENSKSIYPRHPLSQTTQQIPSNNLWVAKELSEAERLVNQLQKERQEKLSKKQEPSQLEMTSVINSPYEKATPERSPPPAPSVPPWINKATGPVPLRYSTKPLAQPDPAQKYLGGALEISQYEFTEDLFTPIERPISNPKKVNTTNRKPKQKSIPPELRASVRAIRQSSGATLPVAVDRRGSTVTTSVMGQHAVTVKIARDHSAPPPSGPQRVTYSKPGKNFETRADDDNIAASPEKLWSDLGRNVPMGPQPRRRPLTGGNHHAYENEYFLLPPI